MHRKQWLVGFAVAGAVAALAAAGCSGDDTKAGPSTDSGTDHTTTEAAAEAATETGAEASDDGGGGADVACTDADLTMLPIPDAALGDSGATAPMCFGCIGTTCQVELAACAADCVCNAQVLQFAQCVGDPNGGGPLMCGLPLQSSGNAAAGALLGCVAGGVFPGGCGSGCLAQCGASNLIPDGGLPACEAGAPEAGGGEGGGEGGEAGGGEAGTDAPTGG